MKKLLALFILLAGLPVCARNIKVVALDDFSTEKPTKTWNLMIAETFTVDNQYTISQGSTLHGKITKVKAPTRGKRNASFVFVPTELVMNGETYPIKRRFNGKYSSLNSISAGDLAKKGAIFAGSKIINSTFGPAVALVEGAVKNEEGNVVKSAAVSVYNSTPLSYTNKGHELVIHKGDLFTMSFKESE